MRIQSIIVLLCGLAAAGIAQAQHETGADVLAGEQAFQSICANCHGAAGNLIAGIDLGHARFRQPYTDEQLTGIILKGIEGKPMPPNPTMSAAQAQQLVAYLRSRALVPDAAAGGDAVRGKALFNGKGECLGCHRVNGEGSRLGPDLSDIGVLRNSNALATSLLDPNAEVQPKNRYYSVVTTKGERVEGRLLNQDAFTVQLLDTSEQLRSFQREALQSAGFLPSPMSSLKDKFSEQELADLVQYLVSLRGDQP
jgi:putative heme-binding domain-containing protein